MPYGQPLESLALLITINGDIWAVVIAVNLHKNSHIFSKAEIHAFAMERYGDWSQQVKDFCLDSKLPIDFIIQTMLNAGLTRSDIRHLEKLSDNKIINCLPENDRELMQNIKDDVIKYINAWVKMLELELTDEIKLNIEELSLQE